MKKGTVKWFDKRRGIGFITGEDGTDYFVHFSGIAAPEGGGRRNLDDGQAVEFVGGESEKGPLATDVKAVA